MTREDYKDAMLAVVTFVMLILVILRMVESEQRTGKDREVEQVVEADRKCRILCSSPDSGLKMLFLEFKVGTSGPYTCRCQESQ